MSHSAVLHLVKPLDNNASSPPEDLARQTAYFDDFMTRHLLDAMPGIVLVLNRYRQVVFTNRAFVEMSGQPEAESVIGRLVGDVFSCHIALDSDNGCGTGKSCRTCGALMAVMSGLEGEKGVKECTLTRQDGANLQSFTIRVWFTPVHHAGENFTVLAGVDISHERRRLALERTFFHDILNVVGSIRGFAELMEVDSSINTVEVSQRIQLASQRVIDEIDAQRMLLTAEKGELQLNYQTLSSRDLLDDTFALYEGQDVARQRVLQIDTEAVNHSFVSDAILLRRILGNMVKNALEASPSGGTVSLGVEVGGSTLSFWVHNGAVIPDTYRQRIFQRDFSTKGSGRGLGTYSMKLLGHFLSGEVSFSSSAEEGTKFFFKVPLT